MTHHFKLPGSDIPYDASESVKSRQAGMTAADAGLIDFRGPRDWRDEVHRRNVRAELARGGWTNVALPDDEDTNVYYYMHLLTVDPDTGKKWRLPVLVLEGRVLPFLIAYALGRGRLDVAERLNYPNVLPVGADPLWPDGDEPQDS